MYDKYNKDDTDAALRARVLFELQSLRDYESDLRAAGEIYSTIACVRARDGAYEH